MPMAFRFTGQVRGALLLIADRNGRSMANMLEWLIRSHCEREGLGWPPQGMQEWAESAHSEGVRPEGLGPVKSVENPSN